MDFVFYNLFLI